MPGPASLPGWGGGGATIPAGGARSGLRHQAERRRVEHSLSLTEAYLLRQAAKASLIRCALGAGAGAERALVPRELSLQSGPLLPLSLSLCCLDHSPQRSTPVAGGNKCRRRARHSAMARATNREKNCKPVSFRTSCPQTRWLLSQALLSLKHKIS